MRLSEAIRLGAMAGRQVTGRTFDGDDTCAMGAALLAIGRRGALYSDVINHFPLTRISVPHPLTGHRTLVMTTLRELNDRPTCWTREAIADWVEMIENAQTTPALSREEASTVEHAMAPSASEA